MTSAERAGTRGDDTCFRMSRRIEEVVHAEQDGEPCRALPGPSPFSRARVPRRDLVRDGVMSRHSRHALRPAAASPGATAPGVVGVVTYLAVLVCVGAGVYIAWRQGSNGGGLGGVIAGSALLVAAIARLLLPRKLSGLLASRRRVTDVLTLTVFGAGLLIAGLVLPR